MGEKGRSRCLQTHRREIACRLKRKLVRKRNSRQLAKERHFSRLVKESLEHLLNCSCQKCKAGDPAPASPRMAITGSGYSVYGKFQICRHGQVRDSCSECGILTFLLCIRRKKEQEGISLPDEIARLIVKFLDRAIVLACNRCCSVFADGADSDDCSTTIFDTGRGVYMSGWYGSYLDNEWACFVDRSGTPLLSREFREIYLTKAAISVAVKKLNVCNWCISEMLNSGEMELCDRPPIK